MDATIRVRTAFWVIWLKVAIENIHAARRFRADSSTDGSASEAEMRSALSAVVASWFALEALHGEIAPLVGREADLRRADRKPPLYLLATFKMAVPGVASRWQQGIEDLYRMRVAAVHPVTEEHATVWNEGLATNTQRERADYSVEGAERAVEFVGTVFEAFFGGRVELHPSLSDVSIKGRQVPAQMAAFEAALESDGP